MKIESLQDYLSKGLGIAGKAVASRSTLPVLQNVLLSVDDGRLKLSGSNLEMGINCWVGARVEEPGSITVPARLFADFVNGMPAERIEMNLDERTQTLNLRCGQFEANIKGIDAQEFPLVPVFDAETLVASVAGDVIKGMVSQVAFSAATDESRPILTGVLFHLEGDHLTMAAADGFRLSVRQVPVGEKVKHAVDVIVPARAVNEMAKIADADSSVDICFTPARNQVLFHTTDVDLVSQLIEGKFPDYTQIIPKGHTTRTVLNTAEFLKAVRIAHLFAEANILKLDISPEQGMSIYAQDSDLGDNVNQVDAVVDGDAIVIAFNSVYLIQALDAMGSAQVALETTSPLNPGVLRPVSDEDFVHVMMPMHLNG
jgi:DNA polymerase-3 subunit beta